MKKFDSVGFGIIAGVILPVLVYMILYFTKVQDIRHVLLSDNAILATILPVLISHCILPNVILFFICNALDKIRTAQGVVVATVIIATGILGTKLILSSL